MEERLIKDLKKVYKNSEFEIIKIPLKEPMDKGSWFENCDSTESLKIDGECIRISWLPYLKELPDDYYTHIYNNIKLAINEVRHRKIQRKKKGIALGPPNSGAPPKYEEKKHVREFC